MLKEHYKYNTIWTLEEKKKLTFPVGNSYFYQKKQHLFTVSCVGSSPK